MGQDEADEEVVEELWNGVGEEKGVEDVESVDCARDEED